MPEVRARRRARGLRAARLARLARAAQADARGAGARARRSSAQLTRLRDAVERGNARQAADADLALPGGDHRRRPASRACCAEFERLTWQVRIFIARARDQPRGQARRASSPRSRRCTTAILDAPPGRRRAPVAGEVRALGPRPRRAAAGGVRRGAVGGADVGSAVARLTPRRVRRCTDMRRDDDGRMLAVLLLAPFMASADATIANVATPAIRADLGASGAALELVVGGYFVAFAVLLITGARLGQTHGYKRLFLAGTGVFGTASLCAGLAPDPALLIVARVLQGAGAALMLPQVLSGIQLHFEGEARARAIGRYSLALSGGAVIGQILGGVLISAGAQLAADLPRQRPDLRRRDRRRAARAAARRRARRRPGRRSRRGDALARAVADRRAADARPGRGLAGLDVDLPGRRSGGARGVPAQPAADRRARAAPAAGAAGPAGADDRDRHVLRAAVHARPVRPARPRPQRAGLGPHARAVGRGVRDRRADRAPPAGALAVPVRIRAARRGLPRDRRAAARRRAARAPARLRRPRAGHRLRRPARPPHERRRARVMRPRSAA